MFTAVNTIALNVESVLDAIET